MACLNVPIVVFKLLASESSVWGSMPDSIGNLSSLQALDFSVTQMNGTIPESIRKLSMLVSLRLGSNSWEGVVTEAHFQNLSQLKSLLLSPKLTLVSHVRQDWVSPFKLRYIELDNVRIGSNFPAWLKTQNELQFVGLNNAGISDTIPHGFWKRKAQPIWMAWTEIPRRVGRAKQWVLCRIHWDSLA
jgi:hypothetical protein